MIFVKLCVSVKGTQECGIELPDIHKFSTGSRLLNGPPSFGASQLILTSSSQLQLQLS